MIGRRPVVREHGEITHDAETDRVGAAARVHHGIAQHHGARRRAGQHGAAVPHLDEGVPHGRVLEHRAQVHRRAAGEVDELCGADNSRVRLVLGVVATEHVNAAHGGPQALEPLPGVLDSPGRMLVRRGRRQHDHFLAAAGFEQAAIEGALLLPLVAADQRKNSSH